MEIFYGVLGSVFGYIFLSFLLAFIAVFVIFLKKKKQGSLNRAIMRVSKEQFKDIQNTLKENKKWFDNTPFEKYTITSYDNTTLSARYYKNADSKKTIICMHGYLGHYTTDFSIIAPYYYSQGYNLLLLNNRAHGKSGGRYIGFSIKDKYDVQYWLNIFDAKTNSTHDIFIHGVSMGAATLMNVSGMQIPSTVKGIICDCGFISPLSQIRYLLKKFFPIALFPFYQIFKFFTKLITGNDLAKTDAISQLKQTQIPMLFIHGEKDLFVPSFMSKTAFKYCGAEKQLELFKTAGHAASQFVEPERFKNITINFIKKYQTN